MLWFPYSSFQQVRQPSIPSPVGEDTSKIWDTTGTVFIQEPSIGKAWEPLARSRGQWQEVEGLLFSPKNSQLVHILRFHSYLRACMKLWIVQKIRFSLHESGWTKSWCPGLVSGPSAKAYELVARIRGLVI